MRAPTTVDWDEKNYAPDACVKKEWNSMRNS